MNFTVVIPVYNTRPDHLLEAVSSIVNQDIDEPFRFILIDDCSTDQDTIDAIEYLSSRMEVIRLSPNAGLASVLNHAIDLCDTEFIVRMDSDDVCSPQRLMHQFAYLQDNPDCDVLGTNLFAFQSNDIRRQPLFITDHPEAPVPRTSSSSNADWLVNHGTVVYRKSAVLAVGGYNPTLRRKQDIDLWRRMYANGAVFRNLTGIFYAWRR